MGIRPIVMGEKCIFSAKIKKKYSEVLSFQK